MIIAGAALAGSIVPADVKTPESEVRDGPLQVGFAGAALGVDFAGSAKTDQGFIGGTAELDGEATERGDAEAEAEVTREDVRARCR